LNIIAQPPKKAFAFSYSRMKNFEACPRRHHEVDLKKSFREAESQQLTWGNAVHKGLELRIAKGEKLPIGMEMYEGLCQKIVSSPGKILVEQQLAINKDFGPTAWFAPDAWFRAKIDVAVVMGPVAMIGDWKTGKIIEDSVQLKLSAATFFAHTSEVKKIRSKFYWLGDGVETPADIGRDELPAFWASIWPRVEALKQAYDTGVYPPIPGRYCRNWCPVKSCEYWGK
jgi:hypothetical protein